MTAANWDRQVTEAATAIRDVGLAMERWEHTLTYEEAELATSAGLFVRLFTAVPTTAAWEAFCRMEAGSFAAGVAPGRLISVYEHQHWLDVAE